MTFWKWSKTAAANATADGTINWAEGMAPSAVNDSARALMAAAAKYRDDINGVTGTGGSNNAYTLSSAQGFDTAVNMHGAMIAFIANHTNTGPSTLNVDGLGAAFLRSTSGVALGPGVLILGTPYVAVFNNPTTEWLLRGVSGQETLVPLGAMLDYTGSSAPNSRFVLPFGQAISRTTYASYFAIAGTTFGAGDGLTTFNVPDLRGRLVAAPDNMGSGVAANRIAAATSVSLGLGVESRTISQANLPNITLPTTINDSGHAHSMPNINTSASGSGGANSFSQGLTVAASLPASTFFGGGGGVSTSTTGITASTALGGSGTALSVLPPLLVLNKILRVL